MTIKHVVHASEVPRHQQKGMHRKELEAKLVRGTTQQDFDEEV